MQLNRGCGPGSAFIFPPGSGSVFNMRIRIQEGNIENARLELRMNFLSQRVEEKWNSLQGETKEAIVKEFKNRMIRKA